LLPLAGKDASVQGGSARTPTAKSICRMVLAVFTLRMIADCGIDNSMWNYPTVSEQKLIS